MSEHLPHYSYQVEWNEEEESYIATVEEFPSLSWVAKEPHDALRGLAEMLVEVVVDMETSGEKVPVPYIRRLNIPRQPR